MLRIPECLPVAGTRLSLVASALLVFAGACGEAPTAPMADDISAVAPSFFMSGDPVVITSTAASTTTFEFLFEEAPVSPHWSVPCQGLLQPPALNDVRWGSPRPANEFGSVHPDYIWQARTSSLAANWVFANTSFSSVGPTTGGQSWSKYTVDVSGLTGPASLAYAADNCAAVYADDDLAQNFVYFSRGGVTNTALDLTGVDELRFILWDGGSAGGLKFVLNGTAGSADSDGDGVPDDEDAFPNSILGGNVSVAGCTTAVANHLFADGSTFNDLIAASYASAANHGKFVSAVTQMASGWRDEGLISGREKGAITSCAARSR